MAAGCTAWTKQEGARLWELPQEPGHAALTGDPEQLILGLRSGHFLFAPRYGHLEALAVPQRHSARHRLNDGKVDHAGRLWFGTMHEAEQAGEGALHLLAPGRQAARIAGPFTVPNGPAFTADGAIMYLADSPARLVLAFDMEDGRPVRRREHLRFSEDEGFPDGMTLDAEDGLWVAHWGGGRVSRFAADGSRAGSIRLPVRDVTSCAFGGADLRTLFVTTARGNGRPDEAPPAASSRSAPRSAAYARGACCSASQPRARIAPMPAMRILQKHRHAPPNKKRCGGCRPRRAMSSGNAPRDVCTNAPVLRRTRPSCVPAGGMRTECGIGPAAIAIRPPLSPQATVPGPAS
ncbi:SMP-30/gluconolactonase/LRE family protein [Siccirubricoccus deserti]